MGISQRWTVKGLGVCVSFALAALLGCGGDGSLENQEEPGGDQEEEPSGEELQECLDQCGEGCPAPEDRVCGNDGERYCNECVMECQGVEPASDASTCDGEEEEGEGDEEEGDREGGDEEEGDDEQDEQSAPEISAIPDQILGPQESTGPIEFTVWDQETEAADLEVTALSLDPDVIAQNQITLGGEGGVRTIEVVAGDEVGSAVIEISVSDGELTSTTTFEVRLTGFCPLMTYECAVGCCVVESHVVSDRRADYGQIAIGSEGNLYITFAHPSSSVWGTGVTVYDAGTGEFDFQAFNRGNARPSIAVAPSGRVHHLYTGNTSTVHYQYSDDQGQSWTALASPPGNLAIGGTCTLAYTAGDLPHLLCGMNESYPNGGIPRYFTWNGASWSSELINLDASMNRGTTMHLGFNDKPHVVHTYGPDDSRFHYSRYTDQWITEVIPLPDGYRISSPDRVPGFALTANDTVHVAVELRPISASEHQVWYGVRSLDPGTGTASWEFEPAIGPEDHRGSGADVSLDIDEFGHPLVFTKAGVGAYRGADGSWTLLQTDEEVHDAVARGGKAYIVYPRDGANYAAQRMHLSVIDLNP